MHAYTYNTQLYDNPCNVVLTIYSIQEYPQVEVWNHTVFRINNIYIIENS